MSWRGSSVKDPTQMQTRVGGSIPRSRMGRQLSIAFRHGSTNFFHHIYAQAQVDEFLHQFHVQAWVWLCRGWASIFRRGQEIESAASGRAGCRKRRL
ncbi:hypothetical protein ACOSP7_013113 [Xanthoceras sorbifolium]